MKFEYDEDHQGSPMQIFLKREEKRKVERWENKEVGNDLTDSSIE